MNENSSRYAALLTEQRNPASENLDQLSAQAIVDLINAEDRTVAAAVGRERERIAALAALAEAAFRAGGRLIYVGAGTSGRLGVLDASECPPTFNAPPGMVVGVIAGGLPALHTSQEGAEDHAESGVAEMAARDVNPKDLVVGIAASGVTPFVIGAVREAARRGARTGFVTCIEQPLEIDPPPDVVVRVLVGPEIITGSTRMKAGTATKLVLNSITTTAMVRIGKTYGNLMVDLQRTCNKLVDRALRITMAVTGLPAEAADELLSRAGGSVKRAIVMHKAGVDAQEADRRLAEAGGFVRRAVGK
ncbi:N-acetylmuramic acid 6-phosphate etherase [bacterium]|nr:N-acetylmuramic acid 6-phosphate etherase [bacterium]